MFKSEKKYLKWEKYLWKLSETEKIYYEVMKNVK